MMKPFLKWAGNKYQIVERIKEVLPPANRLIEPFVGSGAVFLNTDYQSYLLADTNQDLINLFTCLQTDAKDFIEYAKSFFIPNNNEKEAFYQFRTDFNSSGDIRYKSALFLYMNKHGFNGLCRYNSKGKFNVPFGRYKKPYFPEKEMIYFADRAKDAEFQTADFTETMERAEPGDVVYCDPPYVPLSDTAYFTNYSSGGFGIDEQEELARQAKKLVTRGVTVVLSNHDTEFTRSAYSSAKIISFDVQRYISCDGNNRNKAPEVLAIFA
jgi:DNA adenine methylase